ncbi:MAG: trypsin-like peptidase domain-containing protein [Planctomycetaceae bacterium]|nr:trypsin-like peptidase domain-containing protein [Planctomycetaceae bacterium]
MTKRIIPIFVLLFLLALTKSEAQPPQHHSNDHNEWLELQQSVQNVTTACRPAVVGVRGPMGNGSGTLISPDGWIATAGHVVGNRAGAAVEVILADGRTIRGKTCGFHMAMDYGLIKIDAPQGEKLPHAAFGKSDSLLPGQWIVVMAHPLKTEASRGAVVRLGRVCMPKDLRGMVKLDAPLIAGDSGGAIFDLEGKLVAINQAIDSTSANVNYGTPIDHFCSSLDGMKKNEALGLSPMFGSGGNDFSGLNPGQVRTFLQAMISLHLGTPGKGAEGIRTLAANEGATTDTMYLAACIFAQWSKEFEGEEQEAKQGQAVEYLHKSIEAGWRSLDIMELDSALEPLRARPDYEAILQCLQGFGRMEAIGLAVSAGTSGISVDAVTVGSAAADAGFEVGDVIVTMNKKTITDLSRLATEFQKANLSNPNTFEVNRSNKNTTIVLKAQTGINDARSSVNPASLLKNSAANLASWTTQGATIGQAAVEVTQGGNVIAWGSAVRRDGYVVTKLSEIDPDQKIELRDSAGKIVEASVAASDEELDIALLKTTRSFDVVVEFSDQCAYPNVGCLLISANVENGSPLSIGVSSLIGYSSDAPHERPWIGVDGIANEDGGLRVTLVVPESPAHDAGIKDEDIIRAIDSVPVNNLTEIAEVLNRYDAGSVVTLEGLRAGQALKAKVTLEPSGQQNSEVSRGGPSPQVIQMKGPVSKRVSGMGPVIQHDGLVLPHQCGGPLINIHGNVVGLNIARADRTRTYALPAKRVRAALEGLFEQIK